MNLYDVGAFCFFPPPHLKHVKKCFFFFFLGGVKRNGILIANKSICAVSPEASAMLLEHSILKPQKPTTKSLKVTIFPT